MPLHYIFAVILNQSITFYAVLHCIGLSTWNSSYTIIRSIHRFFSSPPQISLMVESISLDAKYICCVFHLLFQNCLVPITTSVSSYLLPVMIANLFMYDLVVCKWLSKLEWAEMLCILLCDLHAER